MDGSTSLIWAFGITKEFHAGCSKSPISKAAASEDARRYQPHFVWPFACRMDLGERRISSHTSEPLSDARTLPGERRVSARKGWAGEKSDFFNTLLGFSAANPVDN